MHAAHGAGAMRNVMFMVLVPVVAGCVIELAGCTIEAKVAPDGSLGDARAYDGDTGPGSDADLAITVSDKPATLGNAASVTFAFATNIPATTECRIDDQPYAACPPPTVSFADLGNGMHAFDLRATAGTQMVAIPTYSFTVDTIAPALAITNQPSATSPVATAEFQFTIDDATTVTCQLDAQAAAPCTSPVAYSALADGAHTFTLVGSDGAGNTTTKTYAWTVDTQAPVLAITAKPPNPSTSALAQFQFTTGGATSVTCKLDSSAAAPCASPITFSSLADGSHTFTLRGTDAANNTTSASYTWTIDTTAPSVAIANHPAATTNATSAQFTFTVGDSATVTCQLDGDTPAACTSPWTYTSLADGAHTFTLKGTDTAGNTTTRTFSWTVDTAAPTLVITYAPANPSTDASAMFWFTVSGATTVTCQLDAQAATACTSPVSYAGLADGSHTFTVRAVDAATNTTTKTVTWTIDTTPPALALTAAPPALSTMTSATFAFTVGDAATVTCQLDAAAAAPCTSPTSYSSLGEGAHTFTLRGTDAAGNVATRTHSWTVDTTPPSLAITSQPASVSTSSTAQFQFTVSGATTVTCQLDGQSAAACTSPMSYSSVADGAHVFTVIASDGAGNSVTKTAMWTVDTTPPSLAFTSTPAALTNQTTATFAFTVGDSATVSCQLDGGSPNACTSPWTVNGLAAGSHSFTLRGADSAGNQAMRSFTWSIDTTPPSVSIGTKPLSLSNVRNPTFTFSASDGATMCSLDFAASVACSGSIAYSALADGGHTFVVSATDAAGNYGSAVYSWTIDATPPAINGFSWNCDQGQVWASWNQVTDPSGLHGTCTYPDGQNAVDCTSATQWSGQLIGTTNKFRVTYTDGAGNSSSKTATFGTLCL